MEFDQSFLRDILIFLANEESNKLAIVKLLICYSVVDQIEFS